MGNRKFESAEAALEHIVGTCESPAIAEEARNPPVA
jgi:hypothetical protein